MDKDYYKNQDLVYLDIETDDSNDCGTDPYRSKIVTVQVLFPDGFKAIKCNSEITHEKFKFLENIVAVGHNLLFECKFIKHHLNITLKNVYDTMIAEHVITGGVSGRTSLNELTEKYCNITLDKTLQRSFIYGKEPSPAQVEYAYQDIVHLETIMKKQLAEVARLNLWNTLEIEMNCVPAVAWMELSGANVDIPTLKEIEATVRAQKDSVEETLKTELTYEQSDAKGKQTTLFGGVTQVTPDLTSPKQLLEALHKKGLKNLVGTGKQEMSKYQGNPIITDLKIWKGSEKLLSGFINPLLGYDRKTGKYGESKFINPVTGRVHPSFNQCGARSGRFSCNNPNLQQQPSRVKEWRHIYKAPAGCKIVAADWSQIELRIVGQLSQEPAYIEAYNDKKDLHKRTAAQMFNLPLEQVTDAQRNMAKSINFGLNYGMGAATLKEKLKMDVGIDLSVDEAQRLKDVFQEMYPNVTNYLYKSGEKGTSQGYVYTAAGRLCVTMNVGVETPEYTSKNRGKNLPIQGLCADMLKTAMREIFLKLEPAGVKLINTVHDELVFECPAEMAEEVGKIVKTEMEKAGKQFLPDLPCVSTVTIDNYWRH